MKPFIFNENEQEDPRKISAKKTMVAVRKIDSGADGNLESYVTINYTDSLRRFVEARLLQSKQDPTSFTLNANIGAALALIELKDKLEKEGVRIDRLVAIFANEDEAKILASLSRPPNLET